MIRRDEHLHWPKTAIGCSPVTALLGPRRSSFSFAFFAASRATNLPLISAPTPDARCYRRRSTTADFAPRRTRSGSISGELDPTATSIVVVAFDSLDGTSINAG